MPIMFWRKDAVAKTREDAFDGSSYHKILGLIFLVCCGIFGGLLLFYADEIVSHLETHFHWGHDRLDKFITELGIAAIVAMLVGIAVEFFLRNAEIIERGKRLGEQDKLYRDSFFTAVLGVFMPKWIITQLRRVFKNESMRQEWKVNYNFRLAPGGLKWFPKSRQYDSKDLLSVFVRIEYTLVNYSGFEAPLKFEHTFEPTLPLEREHSRFLSLHVTKVSNGECVLHWAHDSKSEDIDEENEKFCVRRIKFPGKSKRTIMHGCEDENALRIVYTYETIRRRCDNESWMTTVPAGRLLVRAETDETCGPLDFHFEPSYPDEPEKTEINIRPELDWTISTGLLPYQGFTLHWFEDPKRISEADSVATGA